MVYSKYAELTACPKSCKHSAIKICFCFAGPHSKWNLYLNVFEGDSVDRFRTKLIVDKALFTV